MSGGVREDNGGITASTMFEMYPLYKICANRTDNCQGMVHKRTVVHLSELVLGGSGDHQERLAAATELAQVITDRWNNVFAIYLHRLMANMVGA